ncbi:MAG: hypothetical protein M3Y32_11025 [Pseudomonadota bacterium]|nr:hypothetical protein [Pseudomonadota bacterium]
MNSSHKTTRTLPAITLAALMTMAMLSGIDHLAVDRSTTAAATLAAKTTPASAPRA